MTLYVCSGSGGTGKSQLALTLASEAARRGYGTILLDAAGAGSVCAASLGVEGAVLCLEDTLTGEALLEDTLYPAETGLSVVTASYEGHGLLREYAPETEMLRARCELLIVDTATMDLPDSEMIRPGDRCILVSAADASGMKQTAKARIHLEDAGAACDLVLRCARRNRKTEERLSAEAEEICGLRPTEWVQIPEDTDARASQSEYRKAASALLNGLSGGRHTWNTD